MFSEFFDMLFPECCLACGQPLVQHETLICTGCQLSLPITDYHLHPQNELTSRFDGRVPLTYAFAYLNFVKKGKAQKIVHALKYKGREEAGLWMGKWYGQILASQPLEQPFDLVVPVPLHAQKLKKRGYNQAAAFAEGLSSEMGIPAFPNLLKRNIATETQTRKKVFDRWLNVENIFEVAAGYTKQVEGKHILLVDDVLTTGATMESCAHALLKHCQKVSLAAIAAA